METYNSSANSLTGCSGLTTLMPSESASWFKSMSLLQGQSHLYQNHCNTRWPARQREKPVFLQQADYELFQWVNSSGQPLLGSTALQTGNWYHAALTWRPDGQKIYVNGTLDASNSLTDGVPSITMAVTFGRVSDAARGYFNGILDEIKIYNYARTASEIAQDAQWRRRYVPSGLLRGLHCACCLSVS